VAIIILDFEEVARSGKAASPARKIRLAPTGHTPASCSPSMRTLSLLLARGTGMRRMKSGSDE